MISTRIYTTAKKDDGTGGGSRHASIYATTTVGGEGSRGITDLRNLDYISAMEGEFQRLNVSELLSAVAGYITELSSKKITTEFLEVTKSAHFFELIIDKIKAAGGAVLFTPADGFQVEKAERISGGYRLYWRAQDPLTGKKNVNMWQVHDQAICQNFNEAQTGTSHDVRNKYYWCEVFNVATEPELTNINTEADAKMVECNYIDISTATYDGTVDPEVGDEIAMLGHRGEDVNRQSAIYIAAYKSIDGDIKAPLFATYTGINDFDLSSHKRTYISSGVTPAGKAKGLTDSTFVGSFKIKDGNEDLEDWVDGLFGKAEDDITATNLVVEQNQAATVTEFGKVRQEFKAADGVLSSEISQTNTSVTKLRTDMNSEIDGLEAVDAGIRADLTTTTNTVTSQGNKITNLESTTTTLTNTTSQLRQDVNSISSTVTKHTNSITSINGSITTINGQIGTLNGTVSTHTTQIGSLSTSYDNINATVTSQTTKITNLTTRVGNTETEITNIKKTYATTGYVDVKANEVSLGVTESIENEIVNNTGINIKTGAIDMTADKISFKNSSSAGGTWLKGYSNNTCNFSLGLNSYKPVLRLGASADTSWQLTYLSTDTLHVRPSTSSNFITLQVLNDEPELCLRRGNYGLDIYINSSGKVIMKPRNGSSGWPIEGVDSIESLPSGAVYIADHILAVKD